MKFFTPSEIFNKEKGERKWREIEAGGQANFVFVRGMLLWGGLFGALFALPVMGITGTDFGGAIKFTLPFSLPAGLVWGLATWSFSKSYYGAPKD